MQLELFSEPIESKFERMIDKYDDLRKSQHARISVLQKRVKELEARLEFLEARICKGNMFL